MRPSLFYRYTLKSAREGERGAAFTRYFVVSIRRSVRFVRHCMYKYVRHARVNCTARAAVFAFVPVVSEDESGAGIWKNEVALLPTRPFALPFGKQNARLNHEGDQ